MVILVIVLWIALCFIPGMLAKDKGLGMATGVVLGIVLGPVIGTLVVALIPGAKPERSSRFSRGRTPRTGRTGARSGVRRAVVRPRR